MVQYLLVGMNHDTSEATTLSSTVRAASGLMSVKHQARFAEQVAPLVTSRSLVIFEGWWDGFCRPGDAQYDRMIDEVPVLRSTKPTLLGIDFRHDKSKPNKYHFEEAYIRWITVVSVTCDILLRPTSFEELMDTIRGDNQHCVPLRPLSHEERELGRRVNAMQRKFDRLHLEAMRKHAPRFDRCILVAGSNHCIRIALKTGWEYCNLLDPGEITRTYKCYVADYLFPQLVLGGRD